MRAARARNRPARRNGGQLSLELGPAESIDLPASRHRIEVELGIVEAKTWPARYKMHKYWGRKPANIVSRYIEFFTSPGDCVLDPFAGSAVSVVEAVCAGRRGVGYDLNPFAVRLGRAMLSPPRALEFEAAALRVIDTVSDSLGGFYTTTCTHCRQPAVIRSVAYVVDVADEIRFQCSSCGTASAKAPDRADLRLIERDAPLCDDAPDGDILFGWEMQKLKRRGVKRWRELFTQRNYAAAALLRRTILAEPDENIREWLLLTLTASLAQFTKMIADFSGRAGGPSWKINCYWLPKRWQELNPLRYFANRVAKSVRAIVDIASHVREPNLGTVSLCDSRSIPLDDASVDYIFTDPPYGGEGIQYGELSMLWCLWLGEKQDLGSEIAFNPYRGLSQDDYASGLQRVFEECARVLRPSSWMTVTFANKDPVVWDCLMQACRSAGFNLVTASPMKRSAPALTETTMHTAPKADLVLTFQRRPRRRAVRQPRSDGADVYSVHDAVSRIVSALSGQLTRPTVHDVFDRVTVDWFSWYYENGARPTAVRPTLASVEAACTQLAPSSMTGLRGTKEPTQPSSPK